MSFSVFSHRKRKRDSQQEDQPYKKKPPNAFMLFLKEQRANVQAEVGWRGSAALNTILGQRVSVFDPYVWDTQCYKLDHVPGPESKPNCKGFWALCLLIYFCASVYRPVVVCQCVCVHWQCVVVCPQWRSLTKEQQAKYFSQAEKERLLHSQQHPECSTQDNYVSTPCSHTTHTCFYHHTLTTLELIKHRDFISWYQRWKV